MESRRLGKEERRYAERFEKSFPGLFDLALKTYENKSSNRLEELNVFIVQVARLIMEAWVNSGQAVAARVSMDKNDDVLLTARFADQKLYLGAVDEELKNWIKLNQGEPQE